MAWSDEVIVIEFCDDLVEGRTAVVEVSTPAGVLLVMATIETRTDGRGLVLRGVHMQMQDGRANLIGPGRLRRLASILMERLGYDELVIEGAVRTSGANPGHRPRVRRFARGRRVAPGT